MNIEIGNDLKLRLFGFSAPVPNFNFGEVGISLCDKLWSVVREHHLSHDGINIWVYDAQLKMFSGVAIDPAPSESYGLEEKQLHFRKYAWYKHIGPYRFLKDANASMRQQLESMGLQYGPPSLEIYGHHFADENKLETEIVYTLK